MDRGGGHGAHDLAAGLVALDAGDAGAAVGGLQALYEMALGITIERRAEGGQTTDSGRAFAGKKFRHRTIDQAGACADGVFGMAFGAVVLAHGRGHAALRPG